MRKLACVFLASVLFFSSFLLILSLSAYSFLYPGIYLNALDSSGVFSSAEDRLQQTPGASFIIIPEGGMRALIAPLLTNFLAYVRGDSDELVLEVGIDTPKLRAFFLDAVENVSLCGPGQNYSFSDVDNICRPPEKSPEVFLDEFLASQNKSFFASNVTDLVPVYGLEKGSPTRAGLDNLRAYVGYYKRGVLALGVLILVLIGGLYLLTARKLGASMRWASIPFVMAGTLVLVGVGYGVRALHRFIENDSNLERIAPLARTLLDAGVHPLYLYSGGALVLGLAVLIGSFFIPTPEKNAGN